MGLPKEIMQSFQENPGTDYSYLEGMGDIPVLETLTENSPLAKILGGAKKMMGNMDFPDPNSTVSSQMDAYNWNAKPSAVGARANLSESGFLDGGDRELPSTEELMRRKMASLKENNTNNNSSVHTKLAPVVNMQPSVGIDYGLINTMIKAAVTEGLSGLKTQLLTEGKKNAGNEAEFMTIIKDTIKFVDKSGNIYEGKLKKIGNIS
jgi:hypothetical protein